MIRVLHIKGVNTTRRIVVLVDEEGNQETHKLPETLNPHEVKRSRWMAIQTVGFNIRFKPFQDEQDQPWFDFFTPQLPLSQYALEVRLESDVVENGYYDSCRGLLTLNVEGNKLKPISWRYILPMYKVK